MTRTKPKADPWLCAVAAAQSRADQPDALFAALDEAVKSAIGHKLFTILTYDDDSGEAARVYSNLPGPYPDGRTQAPGAGAVDRGRARPRRGLYRPHAGRSAQGVFRPRADRLARLRERAQHARALARTHARLAQSAARGGLVWRGRCRGVSSPLPSSTLPALLAPAQS